MNQLSSHSECSDCIHYLRGKKTAPPLVDRDPLQREPLTEQATRPERAERRARLVSAIARGRRWLEEITTGAVKDAKQLAARERCTVRQVNLTLSLAFLAPPLVRAAVEGRFPRGINIERLRDPDPNWETQFQDLGLNPS